MLHQKKKPKKLGRSHSKHERKPEECSAARFLSNHHLTLLWAISIIIHHWEKPAIRRYFVRKNHMAAVEMTIVWGEWWWRKGYYELLAFWRMQIHKLWSLEKQSDLLIFERHKFSEKMWFQRFSDYFWVSENKHSFLKVTDRKKLALTNKSAEYKVSKTEKNFLVVFLKFFFLKFLWQIDNLITIYSRKKFFLWVLWNWKFVNP